MLSKKQDFESPSAKSPGEETYSSMAPRGSVNTMYRPLKGYDSATDRNSLWNNGENGKNPSKN